MMTLGALAIAEPVLYRLSPQAVSYRTSIHLDKLIELVRADVERFHKHRNALLKQYGVERPATPIETIQGLRGPMFEIPPEAIDAFTPKLEELCAVPVAIEDGSLLTSAHLDEYKLSREDLVALRALILTD